MSSGKHTPGPRRAFTPGQRAEYQMRAVALSSEWGHKVACEKFGAELVATFPLHTRGRDTGKPQGYLLFIKATRGGWAYNVPGYPQGRIVYPGCSDWKLAMHIQDADPRGHSVVATWHFGRGDKPDSVEVFQTPEQAEATFKAYGTEARYA